jgi:hypothetical protein
MNIRLFVLLTIAASLGWYFVPNEKEAVTVASRALPLRSELVEKSWAQDSCLLIYPGGAQAAAYEAALRPLLAHQSRRGPKLWALPADQLDDALLRRYPLLYLTNGQTTLPLRPLPDLQFESGVLRIGDFSITAPDQVASFSYLPGRGGQSVHLIYSPADSTLLRFVEQQLTPEWPRFMWRAWGYQVQRAGQIALQGYFNDSTWQMDGRLHYDYTDLPQSLEKLEGLSVEQWGDEQVDTRALVHDFSTVRQQIASDWQQQLSTNVKAIVYTSVEDKALRTQRMEVAHCHPHSGEVHLVENAFFRGSDWGAQYRPLLREALGTPHFDALELGLALHYRTTIRNTDWRGWIRQLATAGALSSPRSLANTDWQDYQPLIGLFSAGAWVEFLLETLDRDDFLAYYQQGRLVRNTAELEAAWLSWIQAQYPKPSVKQGKSPANRLNGFTLAHEGYRIFNGYGGTQTAASLEKLRSLGTNAVAIVPYSYMRNPRRASRIPVVRDAGTENDAAVIHAHYQAQALGQFTLLKPQLWINGAWPGDVDFDNDADWEAFFASYREWALHYALLAEIYGFDAYCIGTELRHTTLKHPDRWRKLIKDIRQLYHGPLTYAANWGEECEKLSFWASLDYIGINNYYPLHRDSTASDKDLRTGAQAIIDRLHKLSTLHQRPVWLTEVGYRSASSSWLQPHAEAGKREIDTDAQARCYAALLHAMDSERDWLRGMFWWKWPCYLSHNESNGRGYMPLQKPAAEVVRRYFR